MDRLIKRKKKFINSSENMIKLEQDIQNNNESETELNNQLHSLTDDLKKELGFCLIAPCMACQMNLYKLGILVMTKFEFRF